MNQTIRRAVLAMVIALIMPSLAAAAAAPIEQAQTLISQGKLPDALKVLNSYLKDHPQNAEARFTKGLVLVKMHRSNEAINVFSALTRDYPQLPEPYNNLAVLYAQKGDYQKARSALEAALATNPSYATAQENLGDIYAALAGAAYNRALALDNNNSKIRYKLAMIDKIDQRAPPVGKAEPPAATRVAAAAPAPAPVENSVTKPTVRKPVARPAKPTAPAGLTSAQTQAVTAAVYAWAKAWSDKNVGQYLSHYQAGYHPPNQSHAAWVKERRERVSAPKFISVRVIDPRITMIAPHKVRVVFKQSYSSNVFSDTITKELDMSDTSGSWKITQETVR